MAIQISGSGTITGLSQGGIGGNVITGSNIVNGSVGASKLGSDISFGRVGQVNMYESTAHANYSGNTAANLQTPTYNIDSAGTSKMMIWVDLRGEGNHESAFDVYRSANGGGWIKCGFQTSGTGTNYPKGHFQGVHDADTNSTLDMVLFHGLDTLPGGTTAVAYRIWVNQAGPSVWINRTHGGSPYGAGTSRIMTMEIKA